MQGAKLKEEEVINKWMGVFHGEQKTGQTQWTHLPHELAAVRVLDHHSCPGHWSSVVGRCTGGVGDSRKIQDEWVATEVLNASDISEMSTCLVRGL